ncbi:phage tail tape measure protein [Ktedonospora formicarum]|uniref:Phage tail tape measure protein domain-containing protein n=1 Tax=Ktedonospora formicarum TaxID=2778364 RepID=A0A8J3I0N7_9CHLR|nr:phage tail tape measure protein [Ktedonospora formicarum]GHO44513.1 hypothetical protein KSX_26760 [Ktedonospora formicarum]
MSVASIGLRVYLEDTASIGLGGLTASIGNLNQVVNMLGSNSKQGQDSVKQWAAVAAGGAIDFKVFSDALGFVVDSSSELEQAMLNVTLSVDGAREHSDEMRATLTELDNQSIYSSTEISQAFAALGQHAFTAEQIIGGMGKAVVDLGESIQTGPVPAANLLGSAMDMFKAKTSEAGDYADMLSYALHHGIPSTAEMTQALEAAGAQAHTTGLSFQDFVVTLDILGRAGLSGSQAGTALRYMLGALASPTNKAAQELANLGIITVQNVTPAFQEFEDKLNAAAWAAGQAPMQFDGSTRSLQAMYKQATELHVIKTDESFMEWAVKAGILKNALFDANGEFKGMKGILDILLPQIEKIGDSQDQLNAINNLMGVRGGKALQIFADDPEKTKQIFEQLSKGVTDFRDMDGAARDANEATHTFQGTLEALKSTLTSIAAGAGKPFTDGLKGMMSSLNDFLGVVRQTNPNLTLAVGVFILIGLVLSSLAVVVGVVGAGLAAIATATGAALGPLIGIIAAVAGGIMLLAGGGGVAALNWTTLQGAFQRVGQALQPIITFFAPLFAMLRDTAVQSFSTAWQSLTKIWTSSVVPAWNELLSALKDAQPAFQVIGAALGILAAIIVGVLIGLLKGGILALAVLFGTVGAVITGVIHIIIGVVNILTGSLLFFQGIIMAVKVLFTGGDWGQVGATFVAAFKAMGAGVLGVFGGLVGYIAAILGGLVGVVFAFIGGFVSGFIDFFRHLYDVLVGHSIVPELCDAIVKFISQLPSRALGFIRGLVNSAISNFNNLLNQGRSILAGLPGIAVNAFNSMMNSIRNAGGGLKNAASSAIDSAKSALTGLGSWALSSGQNLMSMLAQGIKNGVSWVNDAINSTVASIKDKIGFHSPTKEGPLSDSDTYMPNMMRMFAQGIHDNEYLVTGAMGNVATGMKNQALVTPTVNRLQAQAAQAGAYGTNPNAGQTVINLNVEGKTVASAVMDAITGELKMNGLNRAWR